MAFSARVTPAGEERRGTLGFAIMLKMRRFNAFVTGPVSGSPGPHSSLSRAERRPFTSHGTVVGS